MENLMKIFIALIVTVSSDGILRQNFEKEIFIDMPQITENNGYPTKEYAVETKDGYMITIFRMSGKTPVTEDLPIFLMHGIVGSADDYVRMGPNQSLSYLLVDQGYDVWLGNQRFNSYSSHKTKSKEDVDYWKFDFDEHGKYDVPVMLEKVLEITKAPMLHYVGYSMGVTSYFIMCHERPDLAKRIATFTALAPVPFLGPRVKVISRFASLARVSRIAEGLGLSALFYNPAGQRLMISLLCSSNVIDDNVCHTISFLLAGDDPDQVDIKKTRLIYSRLQPATLKQIVHYAQISLTDKFSKFDWGRKGNMKYYGQPDPPEYDLSANIAPTALIYGLNDYLASPSGSKKLFNILKTTNPNVLLKPLPYKKFTHLDFVFAKDIRVLVNDEVIKTISTLNDMRGDRNEIK